MTSGRAFRLQIAAALTSMALVGGAAGVADAAPINAFSIVIPHVDIAAAGSPQTIDPNLVAWQTYDSFAGAGLNPDLWSTSTRGTGGSLTTGTNGLTLTPDALAAPGRNNLAVQGTLPVPIDGYFALRVPFVVTTAITDLTGVIDLNVNICAPLVEFLCDSPNWAQGNNMVPPVDGAPTLFSGRAFVGLMDGTNDFVVDRTAALAGQIAIIYSGDMFRNFIDDGTGWRALGPAYARPAAWTPLVWEFDAEVRVLPDTAVPEPATLALLTLGFVGCAGFARRRSTPRA